MEMIPSPKMLQPMADPDQVHLITAPAVQDSELTDCDHLATVINTVGTMSEGELIEARLQIAEEVIESINPSGRYQMRIFWLSIPLMLATAYLVYLMSYVSPEPFAECESTTQPGVFETCTEQEACDLRGSSRQSKIYFDIDCWPKEFNIVCEQKYKRSIGLMITLFLNTFLSSLGLYLCDLLGRQFGWYMSLGLVIVGSCISFFVPDYIGKMIGMGISLAANITYAILLTVMINENTTAKTKLRSVTVAFFFLGYGFGCIFINLFAYISTEPWFLIGVTLVIFLIFGIPCLFLFKETPAFKINILDVQGYIKIIDEIASINRKDPRLDAKYSKRIDCLNLIIERMKEISKEKKSKSIVERYAVLTLLCTKQYLPQFVVLSLIGGYLYSVFLGMSSNIQELGIRDIRINGVIFGVTQAIGNLVDIPYPNKMKRRLWNFIFQSFMMTGAIILLVLGFVYQTKTFGVLITQSIVSSVFCGAGLSALFPMFFLYVSELHPPELRGTANSLVLFTSNLI